MFKLKHIAIPIQFKEFFFLLFVKFVYLFIVFILSFILFILKIFGGGDGKIVILIYLMIPTEFITLYHIYLFFLLFSIFFLLIFILNLLTNKIKRDFYSYEILFNFYIKLSKLKKIYLKTFYKFLLYSDLETYNGSKSVINNFFLVYNESKRKFQILAYFRPPNVVILMFSFILLLFL